MPILPWGQYAPDVSQINGQGSASIINALPQGDGYGPARGISTMSAALEAANRGFFSYFHTDGTIRIFAGTASKLWLMDNTTFTWADVSKPAASTLAFSGGSAIGNMTGGGGLAAAIDGTTNQAIAASASLASTTSGYVGYAFATAYVIRSATVYGTNDQGYVSAGNPSVTLTLYGKNGTPSTATDGTSLGTLTFTDTADEHATPRTVTSTDNTAYTNVWITVSTASSSTLAIAEIAFTGTVDYGLGAGAQWSFTQYGTRVVACQPSVAPQSYVVGSDTNFTNLGGSPPTAQFATTVNDFVILSGLTSDAYTIQWSSRANPAEWTAGTNEGDTQTFNDGGIVRGIAGGEFGLVFQDNAIRRMTYAPGTTFVFQFDLISRDIGLFAPYSLVQTRGLVFFLSSYGFTKWDPVNGFASIGKERVDRTFFENCDQSQKQLIIGAADPTGTHIFWAYKSAQSGVNTQFDSILVYDWQLDRWSTISGIAGEYLATSATPGITLEALDTVSTSIDTLGVSLDDYPTDLNRRLGVFDGSHQLGLFNGDTLEATLTTSDLMPGDSRRVFVRGARPFTDAATVYGSVSDARQLVTDAVIFGTESLINDIGTTPLRADTRFARFKNRIPAATDWSFSTGIEPDFTASGER